MFFKVLLASVCLTYVGWCLAGIYITHLSCPPPCYSAASATLDTRVAGVTPATIEQFPFISALIYYYPRPDLWVQRCVGTVISSWHIITSAECFRGTKAANLRIRAGSTNSMSGGQVTTIRAVTLHPEYVESPRKNNIAVVFLQEPLKLGSTLNVLDIPQNTIIPASLQTTVVSWGFESEQGPIHNSLQLISLTTVSLDECKKAYSEDEDVEINESVLCAGPGGLCSGDSGAPLVQGSVLLGVSSFKDCGNGDHPVVFTRVDAYTDWIMTVAVPPSS